MVTNVCNIADKVGNCTLHFVYLTQNTDVPFASWVAWLLTPVVGVFLFPLMGMYINFFLASLFLRAYGYRYRLHLQDNKNRDAWDGARDILSTIWDTLSWLWNGYEMLGLENIPEPKDGGALLVAYHGAIPVDFYYIVVKYFRIKKRCIRFAAHNCHFKVPGFTLLLDIFYVFTGSFQDCVQHLKEGHLVGIAPGGVREAQFGDEEYHLMWCKRIGFAKVAIEAQVPIIPVFTQSTRECVRTLKFGSRWLRKLYEKTKIPLVPVYGGFPVKLRLQKH